MNYKEPYMAIGIIGGWGMLLLGLSYYARERIGINRWKALHRLTAVAWILGVIHTLGEGTDAGQPWFLALTVAAVAPVALLLAARILTTPAPATREIP
jgi:sulfoxide reductase heme-binding subunit YedZ